MLYSPQIILKPRQISSFHPPVSEEIPDTLARNWRERNKTRRWSFIARSRIDRCETRHATTLFQRWICEREKKTKKKKEKKERERITGWKSTNGWRRAWEQKRERKNKKRKKRKGKRRNGREDPFIGGWRVTMAAGRVIDNGEGKGKKVMEERPRLSFAGFLARSARWSSLSPPSRICTGLASGDSNLLFGRVLHVGRRNNGKSEGGNRPVRERSRTTPACRSSLSPLHEARGRRCVDARDRYSWIGNFLTLFEKEKEDAQFDRFLGCVLKGRVENIWESFDSMEKTRLDRVRSRCGKIGRKIV